MNNKISTLRREIQGANISESSELKKFKGESEISWKSKGNKIQYGFNAEVQKTLSSINWAIDNGKLDYAKELIQEASLKIKDRNKHIRIADSSSGGWETVNQYVLNPIASDSDDESKIYKAEDRAIKKRKMSTKTRDNREQGKSKPPSTAPNPFSDYANQVPRMAYPTRLGPQPPFLKKSTQQTKNEINIPNCFKLLTVATEPKGFNLLRIQNLTFNYHHPCTILNDIGYTCMILIFFQKKQSYLELYFLWH